MEIPNKRERQYNNVTYDVQPATPSDDILHKFEDEVEETSSNIGKQTTKYYSLKMKSIDCALEFVKLTSMASPVDILKISSIILNYIIAKNDEI